MPASRLHTLDCRGSRSARAINRFVLCARMSGHYGRLAFHHCDDFALLMSMTHQGTFPPAATCCGRLAAKLSRDAALLKLRFH
jgi:hypothetical protein